MDDLENKDPFAIYYESGGKKKQHIHFPNSLFARLETAKVNVKTPNNIITLCIRLLAKKRYLDVVMW